MAESTQAREILEDFVTFLGAEEEPTWNVVHLNDSDVIERFLASRAGRSDGVYEAPREEGFTANLRLRLELVERKLENKTDEIVEMKTSLAKHLKEADDKLKHVESMQDTFDTTMDTVEELEAELEEKLEEVEEAKRLWSRELKGLKESIELKTKEQGLKQLQFESELRDKFDAVAKAIGGLCVGTGTAPADEPKYEDK